MVTRTLFNSRLVRLNKRENYEDWVMSEAQVDLNWLCEWLEENSSGAYRPAKDAAYVIRELRQKLEAAEAKAKRPAPCEHACESKAFEIEIRQLKARADKAEAALREAREQKPVAITAGVRRVENGVFTGKVKFTSRLFSKLLAQGVQLYAAPVPAMPVQDGLGKLAENFEFETESKEFKKYAIARKMNMDMHPIHYIFLDGETMTARDAWRAAMNYAVKVLASNKSEVKPS